MVDTAHNLRIGIDASAAKTEVAALRRGFDDLKKSIGGMSSGGGAFSSLARDLAGISSGFDALKNASGGLRSISRDIASLSSARSAANDVRGLTNAFSGAHSAVAALSAGLAGLSIASVARAVQDAGQRITSFKIALDAVAESPREVGEQLKFLNDLATKTGGSLSTMTPAYQTLGTAMRALALDSSTIQKTFTGLQMAFSAMHIGTADQKNAMREFAEVFSMGDLHMRQVQALATHIPTLFADLEKATGKSAANLHKVFKKGGIPAEEIMPKLAQIWTDRFGPQMNEALQHSTAQLNLFDTALERLKQKTYESGFDAGLTNFLKSLTGASDAEQSINSLGTTLGRAFQTGFAALTVLTRALRDAHEPLLAFAGTGAAIIGVGAAFNVAAAAAGFLFSRVGLAATAIVLLTENWETLKNVVAGTDKAFNTGWAYIKGAVSGAFDGKHAGKPILDAMNAAGEEAARAELAKQSGQQDGKDYANAFADSSQGLFSRLGSLFSNATGFDFKKQIDEWRALTSTTPHPVEGHGDYLGTKKAHDEMRRVRALAMQPETEKLYDKLNPALKATHELADHLKKVNEMLGKKGPDEHIVTSADVSRMKEFAKYAALSEAAPAAAKMRDMMGELRVQSKFAGDKDRVEEELKVLSLKHELMGKNLTLAKDEERAYRAILRAQQEIAKGGSNGFIQWANGLKSTTDAMNDNIKSGLDSVADGVAKIATEGKGKFKNLGEAIKAEFQGIARGLASKFIKTGIEGMMGDAIKNLSGGQSSAVTKALGLGGAAVDKAMKGLDTAVATMTVQAAVVNISGGIQPFSNGVGGFNPAAVGGGVKDAITGNPDRAGLLNFEPTMRGFAATGAIKGIGAYGSGASGLTAFGLNGIASPSNNASEMLAGINRVAAARGLNPRDLASVISYETGGTFDSNKWGGKGGNYMGLIQFGPNERKQFGVREGMPVGEQFDSVNAYLKARGGSNTDLAGLYRTINGGNINAAMSASDGNGTIAQHVEKIAREHGGAYDLLTRQAAVATPDVSKLTDAITKAGTSALTAGDGLGSLVGALSKIGGGLFSGGAGVAAGAFSEGGMSNSPVSGFSMPGSFWNGAPHYAEGTPNTSGGIPAVLHENEAVIPLSRGREIPVRLEGGGQGGSGGQQRAPVVHVNIAAKDYDGFRRSREQVGAALATDIGRALARGR